MRRKYYEKNKAKLFLLMLAAVSGVICGLLLASAVGGEQSKNLAELLKSSIVNIGEKSKGEIFLNLLVKNIRTSVFVFLGAMTVWLIPILFVNLFCSGFSVGFTCGFVTASFGASGILTALSLTAAQIFLYIPVTLLFSSMGLECSLLTKNKKYSGENRKKMLYLCLVMLMILTAASLADVFAVPRIIGV